MVLLVVERPCLQMLWLGRVSFYPSVIHSANRSLQELGVPFISISAPSIVSGMSGESEKTLRDTFEEAKVSLLFFLIVFFC